ncbi:M56 family metallopeptidase [Hymenobacter defluvii]|uniref:Peptidase M56 domain-containing protein n=1 Tax=Hymenobacter defluvii TaxID=2054411 RepID=A0ABS3T8W3_9BACT|nr:M56 family metallopeptidase [Hymenobacter defluvii]MBO3270101.1 hypothetical protein [Hymenobacter defluvii]
MPALLLYLLQVNGALLLFYAGYWLVLRRLTFYTLNRWYLLFSVGFSAAYPVVDVSAWLARPVAATTQVLGETWTYLPTAAAPAFTYWTSLEWAYWVGVGVLLLRLLAQLTGLYRIRRASRPAQWHGQQYRRVGAAMNPFSFGRTVYLNPDQHAPSELPAILRHEQVHVQQWHTLDVLVAQLTQVFCWFNPGVWLLRQAVQENLEFITDRAVLRAGLLDAKAYQYSLLKLSTLAPSAALANHFTFLTLKNRIAMMNKKRSATAYLGLYALLIPGLALLAFACAPQGEPAGDEMEVRKTSSARFDAMSDSTLFFLDGKPSSKAAVEAIPEIGIVQIHGAGGRFRGEFGPGVKRIFLVITKTGENSPATKAFRQKYGFQTRAEFEKEEAERPAKEAREREEIRQRDERFKQLPDALYILNGEPVDKEEISEINAEAIESVNVLKGKQAIEQYGEKGRNDVVIVITKNHSQSTN